MADNQYIQYKGSPDIFDKSTGSVLTQDQAKSLNIFGNNGTLNGVDLAGAPRPDVKTETDFATLAGKSLPTGTFGAAAPNTNSALPTFNSGNSPVDTGYSASFFGDASQYLKGLADQEAGLATPEADLLAQKDTGAKRIATEFAQTREQVQQQQEEGNRQIGYAAERLGGDVVLKRNVDDFTQKVKSFTSEIDNTLERIGQEEETAYATNDQAYLTALRQSKLDAINAKRQLLNDQLQLYSSYSQQLVQQSTLGNQRLDTLLQYAALDDATPEQLKALSAQTGFGVDELKALGVEAQRVATANALKASGSGDGSVDIGNLGTWTGAIDSAITGDGGIRSASEYVQEAIARAADLDIKLTKKEIQTLNDYAIQQLGAVADAKTKAAKDKATSTTSSTKGGLLGGGSLPAGSFGTGLDPASLIKGAASSVTDYVGQISDILFGK